MENMICYQCVLKHLAGALSYGKEIISGHGKGADLDHRIDYLGQITNAEHHLQLIDQNLFNQISTYRKQIQSKKIEVDSSDLDFVRRMYNLVQMKEDGIENIVKNQYYDTITCDPDIVYMEVNNLEYFRFSYELLKKNLTNYSKIYVLKTTVDLSGFDVIVVNKQLQQFAHSEQLTDDFIVMYENTSFLRQTDAKKIIPTFQLNIKDHKDIIPQMFRINVKEKIHLYDFIKPQPINKKDFIEAVGLYEGKYIITAYIYLAKKVNIVNDNMFNVVVDRPVCCSTKSNLKVKHYVRWNEAGFQSLKDFFNK